MPLFSVPELAAFSQKSDIDDATATLCRQAAVDYLEGNVGVKLSQQTGTLSYQPRWDDCWIDLPVPTTAVSQVDVDGDTLSSSDYKVVGYRLFRRAGWGGARWFAEDQFAYRSSDDEYVSVDVTCTYGFAEDKVPGEFKQWGLILATQAVLLIPKLGLQSLRIDDYSETYATSASQPFAGMMIPPQVLGSLKARYGRGAKVVESR